MLQFFEESSDRSSFEKAIWSLLRGHNIVQTDLEYSFIQDNSELFTEYISLLGLKLVQHPMGGLYYVQKSGSQEEPLLSAQLCTIFFVAIQKIAESMDDGTQISLFDLINKFEGYDLEGLLVLSSLDPTQLNAFKDVKIRSDDDLSKVLNTMSRIRFLEKLDNSNYRFRRAIVRLSEVAQNLNEYTHVSNLSRGEEE